MRENTPSAISLIGAVFILSIIPVPSHALTPSQVFDKVKDSIVVVKTLDTKGKMKGFGSGVLISPGRVATNCHVVEGGVSYQIGRGKELISATIYAEDGDKDICLLDAKSITGKPAQFGKAVDLNVGMPVYAVGAPKGLELSLSDGIVSQLRGGPPPLIQTTAAISPGSSGGGLFDGEGRLVGLTTLYIEGGQSLNFAMPVEWISEVKPGQKPTEGGRSQTEWLKRASALGGLKDWKGLYDWCLKWTESEPGNAVAWDNLGFSYSELKRYNDAIEAYRKALRINSTAAITWAHLGASYFYLKRNNEAIEAYRQALNINPKIAKVWTHLGVAYSELRRHNDAVDAHRQAIHINRDDTDAWFNLGVAYSELKRHNDAVDAYRQTIRINPKDADAWYCLGSTYHLSGNRNAALEAVIELRSLDPTLADKLFNLIVPR